MNPSCSFKGDGSNIGSRANKNRRGLKQSQLEPARFPHAGESLGITQAPAHRFACRILPGLVKHPMLGSIDRIFTGPTRRPSLGSGCSSIQLALKHLKKGSDPPL